MPTANSGAIVESAPTDICGLEPNSANITVPATKAKRPVSGGMPASREVASCSGTAITSSARAASASGRSQARW